MSIIPGEEHRQAVPIDAEELGSFLVGQGYELTCFHQHWRHGAATVEKNGVQYFMKVASLAAGSPRIENEIAWNQGMGKYMERFEQFLIPEIIESGEWGDKKYYVSSFHNDNPLMIDGNSDGSTFWRRLHDIAELSWILLDAPSILLPKDSSQEGWNNIEGYVQKVKAWSAEVDNDLMVPLLEKFVYRLPGIYSQYFSPCVNHGDFTPWHILEQKDGRLVLVDGEAASCTALRFYDAAYMYHRLCTEVSYYFAESYLANFSNLLSSAKRQELSEIFPILLACRIIGGFRDAKLNSSATEPHFALAEKLLSQSK
jgi:hypothetical protein